MEKEKEKENTKDELLKSLNEEANKPVDEMNVDEIDRIVKLLDTYEDEKADVSDYDEFLARFNSNNNADLRNGSNKKVPQPKRRRNRVSFILKKSCRFAAAAAVFIIAIVSSNAIVDASTNGSVATWIKQVGDGVVFHVQGSTGEGVIENKTDEEEESNSNKPLIVKMPTESRDIYDLDELKDLGIMLPNYIPEEYEFDRANISEVGSYIQYISVAFRGPRKYLINYSVTLLTGGDETDIKRTIDLPYLKTMSFGNFTAYIYKDDEYAAFFSRDGIVYSICGYFDNEAELCKVLENIDYQE